MESSKLSIQPKQRPKSSSYRSRSGCWTCRSRKKKCDSLAIPCTNCLRLGLHCERDVRLVWEDDIRRVGMKRRGRQKPTLEQCDSDLRTYKHLVNQDPTHSFCYTHARITSLHRALPLWPQDLDQAQSHLLDYYIQRFSRTYPTFSGPTNPFLRILLPLSVQNRTVLDALLALSGAQTWENGRFLYQDIMTNLRQRSLRGCANLVARIMNGNNLRPEKSHTFGGYSSFGTDLARKILSGEAEITQNQDFLFLLAICVLLILYEKLTSETGGRGSIHLQFLARVVPCELLVAIVSGSAACPVNHSLKGPLWFLSSLFLYNDLVQSTSLGIPTLSNFYLTTMSRADISDEEICPELGDDRFYFPRLIARIAAGDTGVIDAEITAWDGRLDWFPSFALYRLEQQEKYQRLPICDPVLAVLPGFQYINAFVSINQWKEQNLISELYRIAAIVYRKGCTLKRCIYGHSVPSSSYSDDKGSMGNLPLWATQLIDAIPVGSPFENALLWPIGIIAKEINENHLEERKGLVTRLVSLEQRFKQKNFSSVRQHLVRQWMGDDKWLADQDESILYG